MVAVRDSLARCICCLPFRRWHRLLRRTRNASSYRAFFEQRFPGVPLDDYVYGALIANPGGREQYDQIMEFPPFVGDIEQGKKIWETPFRNGKTFSDCFADGGRNVVGNYPYYDEKLGQGHHVRERSECVLAAERRAGDGLREAATDGGADRLRAHAFRRHAHRRQGRLAGRACASIKPAETFSIDASAS